MPQWEGAILRGKGHPIVKYRDTLRTFVQKQLNRSTCRLGCGRRNHVLDGGRKELRDVAVATNFGTEIAINWLCVNDSN